MRKTIRSFWIVILSRLLLCVWCYARALCFHLICSSSRNVRELTTAFPAAFCQYEFFSCRDIIRFAGDITVKSFHSGKWENNYRSSPKLVNLHFLVILSHKDVLDFHPIPMFSDQWPLMASGPEHVMSKEWRQSSLNGIFCGGHLWLQICNHC